MDFRKIILPFHKWWWLLILSTLAAAGASYLAIRGQPILYQARTTLLVGTTINDPNPTGTDFVAGEQLASAYAQIASRELVQKATMDALGLLRLPEYIARPVAKTQIFEIIVTDTNPQRAQEVANELAAQLILLSPTSLDTEEQSRLDFVNEQLDQIEMDLNDTQSKIDTLNATLGQLESAQEIAEVEQQLTALITKLNTLNQTYASLLASTNQEALNRLAIIEPASLGSRVGPNQITTILLAAVVGLTLAISAAFLLEYLLDNTLKFPGDTERIFDSQIIGHVFSLPFLKRRSTPKITPVDQPHPWAEAYRTLKTNLLFSETDKPLHKILVCSPDKQRGKTQHVVNLAIALATGEKRVILLDADLHFPEVHQLLNISNKKGLGDVLTNRAQLRDVIHFQKEYNLAVIPSGTLPPNPARLLDSRQMDELLARLEAKAEIIIINGPPFIVSDASIIASKVDGILVYVRPAYTKKEAANYMAEQIARISTRVIGISLDSIPRWGAAYFAKIPNYQYAMGAYPSKRARLGLSKTGNGLDRFYQRILDLRRGSQTRQSK